jgi:hypothetical protein
MNKQFEELPVISEPKNHHMPFAKQHTLAENPTYKNALLKI